MVGEKSLHAGGCCAAFLVIFVSCTPLGSIA
jgi:hypothetical protein